MLLRIPQYDQLAPLRCVSVVSAGQVGSDHCQAGVVGHRALGGGDDVRQGDIGLNRADITDTIITILTRVDGPTFLLFITSFKLINKLNFVLTRVGDLTFLS